MIKEDEQEEEEGRRRRREGLRKKEEEEEEDGGKKEEKKQKTLMICCHLSGASLTSLQVRLAIDRNIVCKFRQLLFCCNLWRQVALAPNPHLNINIIIHVSTKPSTYQKKIIIYYPSDMCISSFPSFSILFIFLLLRLLLLLHHCLYIDW
jgi:hypothetical protein